MSTPMIACPEHICVTGMLKAIAAEEGGERFLYMEASNEARDYDNEVVICKALEESAQYYLQFGNVDIDHITLRGAREGIPNYHFFEVGVPVDVCIDPPHTMLKALRGDVSMLQKAVINLAGKGRGRRALLTIHDRADASQDGQEPTAGELLQKANSAAEAGRISWREYAGVDTALRMRQKLDEGLLARITG